MASLIGVAGAVIVIVIVQTWYMVPFAAKLDPWLRHGFDIVVVAAGGVYLPLGWLEART